MQASMLLRQQRSLEYKAPEIPPLYSNWSVGYYAAMRCLSNWIKFTLIGSGLVSAGAPAFAQPVEKDIRLANALIVYGANWCAPCLAELRDLPALAAAMAPAQIIVEWSDGTPRRLWPSWPANARLKLAQLPAKFANGEGESAGLPFAILLDGEGKQCAIWKGRVTAERIARMKANCPASR